MGYSRRRYNNIQRWDAINKATPATQVTYMEDRDKWRKGEWSKWLALEQWIPALVKQLEAMETELSKSTTFVPPLAQARKAVAVNARKNALIHLEAMRAAGWEAEAPQFVERIQKFKTEALYLKILFPWDEDETFFLSDGGSNDPTGCIRNLEFLKKFLADKRFELTDNLSPEIRRSVRDLNPSIEGTYDDDDDDDDGEFSKEFKEHEKESLSGRLISWADGPLKVANLSEEQETLLAHLFVTQGKSAVDYLAMQYERDLGKLQRYYEFGGKLDSVVTQPQQSWVKDRIDYSYPNQTYTIEMIKYGLADRLRKWTAPIEGALSTNKQCDDVLNILNDEAACQTFGQIWHDPKWSTNSAEILSSVKYLQAILEAHAKAEKNEPELDPVALLMSTCVGLWEGGLTKLEGAKLKLRRLHGYNRHALHTDLDNPGPCDQRLCNTGEFEYSSGKKK